MEYNEKKTIAFSLMATLNNTSKNIYECVYMPLFKYGLSQYAKTKVAGQDFDLQKAIQDVLGIKIPLFTIRKMLYSVNDELSRKEKKQIGFNIFEKGKSFQVNHFEYREIDEIIRRENRKINTLNDAFIIYAPEYKDAESFYSFINYNFNKMSSFFSTRKTVPEDISELAKFKKQAEFLKYIDENNSDLYDIAKNIYIGSFITILLETGFELDAKNAQKICYYLDTKIVLSALNFQSESEYIASNELINLIHKNKGLLYVMDKTIEEIEYNISNAIKYFDDNPGISIINNNTINFAAKRNGLSKTDLQIKLKNIRKLIEEKIKANVINVSETVINHAKKSEDLKVLEKIREKRPSTALHDIIAIENIRKNRKEYLFNHKKAKYWFVTENDGLLNFNITRLPERAVPETILPETLVFLLWLKDINKGNVPFLKTGLNEYISRIIVSDLPDYIILDDLYDNLRKYKDTDADAVQEVMDSLADASYSEIKTLNNLAKAQPDNFAKKITGISMKKAKEKHELMTTLRKYEENEAKANSKIDNLLKENNSLKTNLKQLERDILPKEKYKNDELQITINQMKNVNKRQRSIIIALIASLLCFLIVYFSYKYLLGYIRNIVVSISSLGGLWSFIDLLINIIKSIKKKKKLDIQFS